jgi:hypothetical protein
MQNSPGQEPLIGATWIQYSLTEVRVLVHAMTPDLSGQRSAELLAQSRGCAGDKYGSGSAHGPTSSD